MVYGKGIKKKGRKLGQYDEYSYQYDEVNIIDPKINLQATNIINTSECQQ